MQTKWLSHLKGEEQEEFKKSLKSARNVLDKLRQIVYTNIESRESISRPDYDSPSWSHKQAHNNGYVECARELLNLLDLDQRNINERR